MTESLFVIFGFISVILFINHIVDLELDWSKDLTEKDLEKPNKK